MTSPAIELRRVQKSFGNTSVIRDVNLTVVKGERQRLDIFSVSGNGSGCALPPARFNPPPPFERC
jgi:branched-chain amino acid transport system ATP-binding protein